MLDLTSPRWSELQQCYGPATEIPQQLSKLLGSQNCSDDPHDVLFSRLCHQGTVYAATYAAVPHCVAALPKQGLQGQITLLMFLGEAIVTHDRPPVPNDLSSSYFAAIETLKPLAIEIAKRPDIPSLEYSTVLDSVPAVHGLWNTHIIVDCFLVNCEIVGLCKYCQSNLHVLQSDLPLVARPGSEPDEDTDDDASEVTPAELPQGTWDGTIRDDNALDWLTAFASEAGQIEITEKIRALFGTLSCPSCQRGLCLWDAAVAECNAGDEED